ncbi:unnamed protein product [Darwinula stevensoni]|uniref:Uncharacterized protein n=1 Tax=Darwinula stevensoni TaxID=69355 RepID=A0A7R8XEQ7_9CRUS|nr:unnamed protein product [Darwinula stevensoni]CAG0896047.1 unnamed protein product [Darwinula stevensoni]
MANIEEVGRFPGVSSGVPGQGLPYATRQLIAREIQLERMRRSDADEVPTPKITQKSAPQGAPEAPKPKKGKQEEGGRVDVDLSEGSLAEEKEAE